MKQSEQENVFVTICLKSPDICKLSSVQPILDQISNIENPVFCWNVWIQSRFEKTSLNTYCLKKYIFVSQMTTNKQFGIVMVKKHFYI